MRTTKKTVSLEAQRPGDLGALPGRKAQFLKPNYGMHYIHGNRRPYFSLTATIYQRHRSGLMEDVGGGCCHDDIAKSHPELAELVPFHLWDQDGTPMHFVANGTHWLECYLGLSRWGKPEEVKSETTLGHLRDTIGCDVLGDHDELSKQMGLFFSRWHGMTWVTSPSPALAKAQFANWLESRLPAMRAAFLAAMEKHGCELIRLED